VFYNYLEEDLWDKDKAERPQSYLILEFSRLLLNDINNNILLAKQKKDFSFPILNSVRKSYLSY